MFSSFRLLCFIAVFRLHASKVLPHASGKPQRDSFLIVPPHIYKMRIINTSYLSDNQELLKNSSQPTLNLSLETNNLNTFGVKKGSAQSQRSKREISHADEIANNADDESIGEILEQSQSYPKYKRRNPKMYGRQVNDIRSAEVLPTTDNKGEMEGHLLKENNPLYDDRLSNDNKRDSAQYPHEQNINILQKSTFEDVKNTHAAGKRRQSGQDVVTTRTGELIPAVFLNDEETETWTVILPRIENKNQKKLAQPHLHLYNRKGNNTKISRSRKTEMDIIRSSKSQPYNSALSRKVLSDNLPSNSYHQTIASQPKERFLQFNKNSVEEDSMTGHITQIQNPEAQQTLLDFQQSVDSTEDLSGSNSFESSIIKSQSKDRKTYLNETGSSKRNTENDEKDSISQGISRPAWKEKKFDKTDFEKSDVGVDNYLADRKPEHTKTFHRYQRRQNNSEDSFHVIKDNNEKTKNRPFAIGFDLTKYVTTVGQKNEKSTDFEDNYFANSNAVPTKNYISRASERCLVTHRHRKRVGLYNHRSVDDSETNKDRNLTFLNNKCQFKKTLFTGTQNYREPFLTVSGRNVEKLQTVSDSVVQNFNEPALHERGNSRIYFKGRKENAPGNIFENFVKETSEAITVEGESLEPNFTGKLDMILGTPKLEHETEIVKRFQNVTENMKDKPYTSQTPSEKIEFKQNEWTTLFSTSNSLRTANLKTTESDNKPKTDFGKFNEKMDNKNILTEKRIFKVRHILPLKLVEEKSLKFGKKDKNNTKLSDNIDLLQPKKAPEIIPLDEDKIDDSELNNLDSVTRFSKDPFSTQNELDINQTAPQLSENEEKYLEFAAKLPKLTDLNAITANEQNFNDNQESSHGGLLELEELSSTTQSVEEYLKEEKIVEETQITLRNRSGISNTVSRVTTKKKTKVKNNKESVEKEVFKENEENNYPNDSLKDKILPSQTFEASKQAGQSQDRPQQSYQNRDRSRSTQFKKTDANDLKQNDQVVESKENSDDRLNFLVGENTKGNENMDENDSIEDLEYLGNVNRRGDKDIPDYDFKDIYSSMPNKENPDVEKLQLSKKQVWDNTNHNNDIRELFPKRVETEYFGSKQDNKRFDHIAKAKFKNDESAYTTSNINTKVEKANNNDKNIAQTLGKLGDNPKERLEPESNFGGSNSDETSELFLKELLESKFNDGITSESVQSKRYPIFTRKYQIVDLKSAGTMPVQHYNEITTQIDLIEQNFQYPREKLNVTRKPITSQTKSDNKIQRSETQVNDKDIQLKNFNSQEQYITDGINVGAQTSYNNQDKNTLQTFTANKTNRPDVQEPQNKIYEEELSNLSIDSPVEQVSQNSTYKDENIKLSTGKRYIPVNQGSHFRDEERSYRQPVQRTFNPVDQESFKNTYEEQSNKLPVEEMNKPRTRRFQNGYLGRERKQKITFSPSHESPNYDRNLK